MLEKSTLETAIERFARVTVDWPDAELERYWAWRAYDDGVRHAFFRTYEELRELATTVASERVARREAPTIAHRALAQYHLAFRDLQAVLLGISDADGDQQPTPDDWPLRQVVVHIIRSERQFFARIRYAVDRVRSKDGRSVLMSDGDYEAFYQSSPSVSELMELPLSEVLTAYSALHDRVLGELSDVRDDEQDSPSVWWEEEELPIRFRFHRLDAHLRQHIVHAEKTLDGLGLEPTEAKRLSRLLYGALAELEGNLIGESDFARERCQALARVVEARLREILPS